MEKDGSSNMSNEVKELLNTIKSLEDRSKLQKAYEIRLIIAIFIMILFVVYSTYEKFF